MFDRKNYFYPDLPPDIRSASTSSPIVGEGEVTIDFAGWRTSRESASSGCISSRTPARRCTTSTPDYSYVDLNRAGVALMEIVTKPDMRGSEEAVRLPAQAARDRALSRHLRRQHGRGLHALPTSMCPVRRAGRSDAGHALRDQERELDAVHRPGGGVRGAAAGRILESGGKIDQETRLFDARAGETRSMRSKEEAHDYRYFPDPDLLPLELEEP